MNSDLLLTIFSVTKIRMNMNNIELIFDNRFQPNIFSFKSNGSCASVQYSPYKLSVIQNKLYLIHGD